MEFRRFRGTDKYLTSPALEAAVNCALALERPLLVRGEPGTGKTHLAEAIPARLAPRRPPLHRVPRARADGAHGAGPPCRPGSEAARPAAARFLRRPRSGRPAQAALDQRADRLDRGAAAPRHRQRGAGRGPAVPRSAAQARAGPDPFRRSHHPRPPPTRMIELWRL